MACGTTAAAGAVSLLAPADYATTGVGAVFCVATYLLVLRADSAAIRAHGLAFGGLLLPEPIDFRHLLRELASALRWTLLSAAIWFPLFVLGYLWWWQPRASFQLRAGPTPVDEALGQLLAIALPEEIFFRGYLQTALDRCWKPRWQVFGAPVGPALLVSSAIFAAGHLLTVPHPARLAVFFPSLMFGWLRARSGGVGASIAFHAACNLLSAYLGRSFDLLL